MDAHAAELARAAPARWPSPAVVQRFVYPAQHTVGDVHAGRMDHHGPRRSCSGQAAPAGRKDFMNRFSDELRIIPGVVWAIAVLIWPCMFSLLMFVAIPHDATMQRWPGIGQIAFSIWPGLLLAALVLLIGYINADARRGMRYVMWTWLAIVIPNSVGIILYFVMRDPLPLDCPKCQSKGRPGFAFCPQCGAGMSRS